MNHLIEERDASAANQIAADLAQSWMIWHHRSRRP
jgi:hypothetical protein